MKKGLEIADILSEKYEGEEVALQGWVYRERSSNAVAFIVLRDASGRIQCVFKKEDDKEAYEEAVDATLESAVRVNGTVKKDERAPTGYELQGDHIEIIHRAERFPITKDQSTEFLLDERHLWIRSRKLTNVMRIKHTILDAARDFFDGIGAYEVNPPIFTPNACEGGTTLFELDYFDEKVYLSQSAQMYLEALIFSLENVYALTPSFRAEKSRTKRHLTEYWHLEWEGAWTDHEKNVAVQEQLLEAIAHAVAEHNAAELEDLGRDPSTLRKVEAPFPRITYTEAIDRLQEEGFDIAWGADFGTKEERFLTSDSHVPLVVTHYPEAVKAFYMKRDDEHEKVVKCNDVLAPEGFGEIIGGSERETDIHILRERLEAEEIPIEEYEWYLDLRRFGSIPHSGFGLGVERAVRWICNLEHIRDAIPFPRTLNRYAP